MAKKKTRTQYIKEAADAMGDMNALGAIMALCQNSLLTADHQQAEHRIIMLCQAESQKALVRYDRAVAAANK
jgi:hypothetical protein